MKLLFLVALGFFLLLSLILTVLFLNDNTKELNTNSHASTDTNVYLNFENSSVQLQKNQLFTSLLNIKTAQDIKFQGYSITLDFDKNRLQLVNIDYTIGTPSIGLATDITNMDEANTTGNISLFSEIQSSTGYTLTANQDENLVALQFKYIGNDLAQVNVDENLSTITKIDSNSFLFPITPKMQKPLLAGNFISPTTSIRYPQTTNNTDTPLPTQITTMTPVPTNISITLTPLPMTKTVQKTNTPSLSVLPTFSITPVKTVITTPVMNTISPTQIIPARMETKDLTNVLIWIIVGSISLILLSAGIIFLMKK